MKSFLINCLLVLILLQSYNFKLVNIFSDFKLDFTSTSGWSGADNNAKHSCRFGNIFGPFGQDNRNVERTFTNLPPHYSLSMSIIYYSLWSWDYETLGVYIDNNLYYSRSIWIFDDLYDDSNCVGGYTYSQGIPLAFNITHTQSSVNVKFTNNLNEVAINEAMGLSRFYLNVDECHYTCLSCNGPNENQCQTCPQNSIQTGSTCQCNSDTFSSDHNCVVTCPDGFSSDTSTRRCNENCPINNCSVCTDQLCTSCNSGFKLSKGNCFDRCPWYTTETNGICVDTDYDNIPRPYLLAENMINKDFNHGEIQSQGWRYKKFQTYGNHQFSNLVSGSCSGLSYAAGYNYMPFRSETCSSGCGLLNSYNNLPAHYYVTVKYQILCGDTWDNEPYYLVVDGTEVQRNNYQITTPYTQTCSNYKTVQQNVSKTTTHISNTLNIELGYQLNEDQQNEWAGYREVLILLHLCDNINCSSCTKTGMDCTSCVGSTNQESSRILNNECKCPQAYYDDGNPECQACVVKVCFSCSNKTQCDTCIGSVGQNSSRISDNLCICPDSYFDDYPNNDECQKCNYVCSTCINDQNNCTQCSDINRDLQNNCKCIDTFYNDGTNPQCQECQFPCINCTSSKVCTSCAGDFRQTPMCACIQGYFNNDQQICQECDIQCKSCINSQDNCLICKSGLHRTMEFPQCDCRIGYYAIENDINCVQCFSGCRICEKFTGKCLECDVPTFSTLNCQEESQGIFLETINDSNNLSLEVQLNGQCQNQCLTCQISANNCTSCKVGINRQNNPPSCDCKLGYHDNMNLTDDCQICPKICQTCKSQNYCLSCFEEQNRVINKINMKCECKNNFKQSKTQPEICVPCYQYKGECFFECPFNTIQDNKSKTCVEKIFKKNDYNFKLIVICGISIILVQIVISLVLKIFTQKKINLLQKKPEQKSSQSEKSDNSQDKSQIQNELSNL